MKNEAKSAPSIAQEVRRQIDRGGERLWRLGDFEGSSFSAVAQALSRLAREGFVERLSKGVYYRHRPTSLGKSRPNPASVHQLAAKRKAIFPAGIAAANQLGFTTQASNRREVSTNAASLPRKLVGREIVVHTRRPEAWAKLSAPDAALLDFLRQSARSSELSPEETIHKVLALLSEGGRFERLVQVAATEPPRVRAMLGALGQQLGKPRQTLQRLRAFLNPYSQFDFGRLVGLRFASNWQAKKRRS